MYCTASVPQTGSSRGKRQTIHKSAKTEHIGCHSIKADKPLPFVRPVFARLYCLPEKVDIFGQTLYNKTKYIFVLYFFCFQQKFHKRSPKYGRQMENEHPVFSVRPVFKRTENSTFFDWIFHFAAKTAGLQRMRSMVPALFGQTVCRLAAPVSGCAIEAGSCNARPAVKVPAGWLPIRRIFPLGFVRRPIAPFFGALPPLSSGRSYQAYYRRGETPRFAGGKMGQVKR